MFALDLNANSDKKQAQIYRSFSGNVVKSYLFRSVSLSEPSAVLCAFKTSNFERRPCSILYRWLLWPIERHFNEIDWKMKTIRYIFLVGKTYSASKSLKSVCFQFNEKFTCFWKMQIDTSTFKNYRNWNTTSAIKYIERRLKYVCKYVLFRVPNIVISNYRLLPARISIYCIISSIRKHF